MIFTGTLGSFWKCHWEKWDVIVADGEITNEKCGACHLQSLKGIIFYGMFLKLKSII